MGRTLRTLLVFPIFTTVDQSNLCFILPDVSLQSGLKLPEDKKNLAHETNNKIVSNNTKLNSGLSVTSLDGTDLFSDVTKVMLGFFNTTQISYGKNTTKCQNSVWNIYASFAQSITALQIDVERYGFVNKVNDLVAVPNQFYPVVTDCAASFQEIFS